MAAAPIHFEGLSFERSVRLLRAIGRVLLDSEKTSEIVVAEEITAQAQLRYWVKSGLFERGEGPELLRGRPRLDASRPHMVRYTRDIHSKPISLPLH